MMRASVSLKCFLQRGTGKRTRKRTRKNIKISVEMYYLLHLSRIDVIIRRIADKIV